MIMPIMDQLLVAAGMIYTPEAPAGIHIVVIPTSFPQGVPMVPLVRFTLEVTRSLWVKLKYFTKNGIKEIRTKKTNNKNPLLKQQMEANMQKMFQMQAFSSY